MAVNNADAGSAARAAQEAADALIAPLLQMVRQYAGLFAELDGVESLPDLQTAAAVYRAAFARLGAPVVPLLCCTLRSPAAFALYCWMQCSRAVRPLHAVVQPSGVNELPAFSFDCMLAAPPPSAVPSDIYQWSSLFADLMTAAGRKNLPALVVEPVRGLSPLFAAVPLLLPGAWAVLPLDGAPLTRTNYYSTLLELFETVVCLRGEKGALLLCRDFRRWRPRDTARFMETIARCEPWRRGAAQGDIHIVEMAPWPAPLCQPAARTIFSTGLRAALFCH
jgi:hypothetical protein